MRHWGWAGVLLAVLWAVGAFALGYEAVYMPGDLSALHTSQGFGREAVGNGLRAVASSQCRACHDAWTREMDDNCIACHPQQKHLIPAHRPKHFQQYPALAKVQLTCASCHREHRGRETQLKQVPNEVCETCHFHKHQPDEHEWWRPANRPTSQPSHVPTLYRSPENCVDCHVQHGDFELKGEKGSA